MPRRLCRKCEYFEEIDRDGYCYRYPPKIVVIDKIRPNPRSARQIVRSEYPIVDKDLDWCGEYEKKEEEEDDVVINAD